MLSRDGSTHAPQSGGAAAPPHPPTPAATTPAPASTRPRQDTLVFALHGFGGHLSLNVPAVRDVARTILAPLLEPHLPGEPAVQGTIAPYDEAEVLRYVSPTAVRLEEADPLLELYRDPEGGERFWLVDERWGLCEINMLRRSWRSWILPAPACDPVRLFESAVLWPMAQLLRSAGLHLIPGAAVGREGRGVLILSPYDVGPELEALGEAGVGIIGQRWVALREEADGRVALLSVPGRVEKLPAPRLLSSGPMGQATWTDASAGGERTCHHAFCELVLLVEPMRRSLAGVAPMSAAAAREQLKLIWPIPLLSAGRSPTVATNQLAAKLARDCRVHRVRLSRNGADLARLLVRPAPTPSPSPAPPLANAA